MKTLILKKILQQHGFKQDDIEIANGRIKLKIKDVAAQDLRQEGAPIPNKKDSNYHNYIYPEGFIAQVEKIELTVYPKDHPKYPNRLNTIRVPSTLYKYAAETANTINQTNHAINKSADTVLLTVDYSKGSGSDAANQLMAQIISELKPKIADKDDIRNGINYISDLGRLLPLLDLGLIKEIKDMLEQGKKNGPLLQLRDRIQNSPELVSSRVIDLDLTIFHDYVEKLVREEGYLAQLVRNHLALDQKNWILTDQDLLTNYLRNNDANSAKLKLALQKKDAPLFISTTTGMHAFAVKVDFQSKTLFLANPGNGKDNCELILNRLKEITGCTKVVPVITKILKREEDIPFNDLCTVDSLALAQMMMDQQTLSEGSMNDTTLKTGVYVKKALELNPIEVKLDKTTPVVTSSTPGKDPLKAQRDEQGAKQQLPEQKRAEKRITELKLSTQRAEQHDLNEATPLIRLTPRPVEVNTSTPKATCCSNLTMQLLGGFITCLGIAAVAVAFTVLNAATFGAGGLVVAGIGIAATLAGVGLFAAGSFKAKTENNPQTEQRLDFASI